MEIIPAIIGQNFTEVEEKIKTLNGLTNWVHLDVMDGKLTPQISWATPDDLSFLNGKTKIEVHLMVQAPEDILDQWLAVADRVLVHVEATDHLNEILDFFNGRVVEPGLALNLTTSADKFEKEIKRVGLVQLMAIAEIGEQGHPFEERVFEKIRVLRALAPSVKIQIDGGVNLDNVEPLKVAGADNLVIGSAIWQAADPVIALKKFQSDAFTRNKN